MELPCVSLNLSQTECTCECKPGMSLQFVYYTNSSVLVTLKRVHADSSLLMAVMGSSIDGLLHCRLTVTITWTPSYDLHKISDTQSILMYHSVLKV